MERVNGEDWIDIGGGRRGFRDRNDNAGIAGTEITAAWLNGVQEEPASVIEGAGLALDAGDSKQLLRAIRSLNLNYVTAGGTANALTVPMDPAPESYDDLRVLIVIPAARNTGPATIRVAGLDPVPIITADGPLAPGTLLIDEPAVLIRNDVGGYTLHGAEPKARCWNLVGANGTIPHAVLTRMANYTNSESNMLSSTVSASAGTVIITADDAGVYVVSAAAAVSTATLLDAVAVRVNGVVRIGQSMESPSVMTAQDPSVAGVVVLFAGDIVDAAYSQSRGGGTNTLVNGSCYFSGARIGAL